MKETTVDEGLTLREQVFVTLRRKILRGELVPGEKLREIKLAGELGVSRTPVREAIRQLENEGLVVMLPHRGAQVASITQRELADVLEVRRSLEKLAISCAVKRMTKEDERKLLAAEKHFESVVRAKNVGIIELGAADEGFHEVIYSSTGNRRLMQILSNLREQMYRFRVEYMKNASVREELIEEHARIVQAIRERDEEKAVAYMDEHIVRQMETISKSIRMAGS